MKGCVVKCVFGNRDGSWVMFIFFDTETITSYNRYMQGGVMLPESNRNFLTNYVLCCGNHIEKHL